jgi:hypothetical protein
MNISKIKSLIWHNVMARDTGVPWVTVEKVINQQRISLEEVRNLIPLENITIRDIQNLIKYIDENAMLSFSQSGEDMVIRNILRDTENGFYVDVGAHHPTRFSNTYYFYLKGWKGINIDPIPGVMDLFDQIRPRDINLELAVGAEGVANFYQFLEGAYNTFDSKIASEIIKKEISPLISKHEIKKTPLKNILQQHLPLHQQIDILSIDAEGLDVEILETNDWEKYRPRFVCAECHSTDPSRPMNPGSLLIEQGYQHVASTEFSSIYKRL